MKVRHLILSATTALMASNAYSAITYTYDADGRVIEENWGSGKYTYTYDGNNQTSATGYFCSNGSRTTRHGKEEYTYAPTEDGGIKTTYKTYDYSGDSCVLEETFVG